MKICTKELILNIKERKNRVYTETDPPIFEDDTVLVLHRAPKIKEGVVRIR